MTTDRNNLFLVWILQFALFSLPLMAQSFETDTTNSMPELFSETNDVPSATAMPSSPEFPSDYQIRKEVHTRSVARANRAVLPKFLEPFAKSKDEVAVRVERMAAHANLVAGREYLPGNQSETSGYGLYSYVLFAEPPTSDTTNQYLELIKSFQELVPDINALKDIVPMDGLNITYFPVTVPPQTEQASSAVAPEWLLEHYNYARAKSLLAKLNGPHGRNLYLISTLKPLSEAGIAVKPYADQDLSWVPPELVRIWIREFFVQTSQEKFWQPRTGEALILRMRTVIAIAANGLPGVEDALRRLGLPTIDEGLKKWIIWVK